MADGPADLMAALRQSIDDAKARTAAWKPPDCQNQEAGDTMSEPPLPCIACGTVPECAMPSDTDEGVVLPYGATQFHSYGHYGSTIWDPMSDRALYLNVCDRCIVKAAALQQIQVVTTGPPRPASLIVEFFDPARHDCG